MCFLPEIVGNPPRIGVVHEDDYDITRNAAVILPNAVEDGVYGRLTHFTAYFTTTGTVIVQLYRRVSSRSSPNQFYVVYEKMVVVEEAETAQTVRFCPVF